MKTEEGSVKSGKMKFEKKVVVKTSSAWRGVSPLGPCRISPPRRRVGLT